MILERAIAFWENHVLKDVPPKTVSESDCRQLFHHSTQGKIVEADHDTTELIKKLQILNENIEDYETQISTIKQHVMSKMEDAEVLTFNGQTLATWKAPKESLRLDTKRLSEEHPELVTHYQVPIQNNRRLVIKQ